MLARNLQEHFNAIFVVWSHFTSGGVKEYWGERHPFALASKFAQSLLLASSEAQVVALIGAHPKRAGAFLAVLNQVKKELTAAGACISATPETPLLLYTPAAEAVAEAVLAYRAGEPYLARLLRTSGPPPRSEAPPSRG